MEKEIVFVKTELLGSGANYELVKIGENEPIKAIMNEKYSQNLEKMSEIDQEIKEIEREIISMREDLLIGR